MHQISLDAIGWQDRDDVMDALLAALGAPEWHGRTLDALFDSLAGGQILAVWPPLAIEVSGDGAAPRGVSEMLDRIERLFQDVRRTGDADVTFVRLGKA
ncbi:barstar family protein [Sphingosinithalassobacter sp. CS137]|uniref:barstar family protein n=1 Tax=Sphingosinithalassobacter sp. CS137 TaxID=2762748 RepID=UPI00165DDD36|nr:barstar family protein [Sphingosinithalassobacter sp. CS137]